MKGSLICCLRDMVTARAGAGSWENILLGAGADRGRMFFPTDDIEDKMALAIFASACKVLDLPLSDAADAFGHYWMTVYAPAIYSAYFLGACSARDFLLKMDRVHEISTRNIAGARPPRFGYQLEDDGALVMTYASHRGLIDFMVGLIKGVGARFHEELLVEKISDSKVRIRFQGRSSGRS